MSNKSVALLVFKCVPKTLVVFLDDCGNLEADKISHKNVKLWHFVCPIQNDKCNFCSSTDVQNRHSKIGSVFGQYLW